MNVIDTNQLKSALERLCLVVPKRGSLPVLENLRWRVVNGHLELTATDLDNSLHISMPFAGPAALHRVLFCVSAEASRYSTDVLRLEMRESVFRLVGTDGHRLSLIEGAAKSEGSSTTLLLRSTGAILNRLGLAEDPRWVQFSTCGSEQEFLVFILPDGAGLIARRGQGQFPNYENVLPKSPLEAKVVFRRAELLEGLTKLSPTARKAQSPVVKLELSKSPVSIKAENDGTANRVALEHTRVLGKARDIGFNHQYLTQYVKSLETDTVSMKLFPPAISEVVVFDAFRYQHLLMPIRD
jgi:DNA polymerase-3 subunit beta